MPSQRSQRRPQKTDHPGIFRKGNRYIDTWKDHGKSRSESYRTLTAAVRGRAQRIASGNRPGSRERFDKYATRWLDSYRGRTKRGLAASTRADYERVVENWLIPYFRHTPLGDITPGAVRDFVDHLCVTKNRSGDPLAAATIRWIMVPLKTMLAEAYEHDLIPLDASRIRIIVPDRTPGAPRRRTISADETAEILDAIPTRYRLLFTLLAYTGLRISEALGLQWQDLEQTPEGPVLNVRRQFYRGQLQDQTKTAAGTRQVALIAPLARELTRHRSASVYAADDDPIFPTKYGTHLSAHNVRRVMRPTVDALGLPWVTPHVFRHSLATTLRDAGHDAHAIAQVLGHSDPSFTQRTYIHETTVVRFDEAFARREDNLEDNQLAETPGNRRNRASE